MSKELEEKLREIVYSIVDDVLRGGSDKRGSDFVAQIHQAYKEAGYVKEIPRIQGHGIREAGQDKIQPLMTGQEWLKKFDELLPPDNYHRDYVMEIAKKAAGL